MEISDFHCHEWINISSVMTMKTNLDTLTGREFIEEDWEHSNELATSYLSLFDVNSTMHTEITSCIQL